MKFPHKRKPRKYNNSLGWASVFHGTPAGTVYFVGTLSLLNRFPENVYLITWGAVNTVAFLGLVVVGILVIVRWRYALLALLPLSIIGFLAFPLGTIIYYYIYHDFWVDFHWFYPFDKHATFLEDSYNDVNSETHHS